VTGVKQTNRQNMTNTAMKQRITRALGEAGLLRLLGCYGRHDRADNALLLDDALRDAEVLGQEVAAARQAQQHHRNPEQPQKNRCF
jgi:hypothetical protein